MKRLCALLLAALLCLGLCACEDTDDLKDIMKTGQDVVTKYGQQIEDSKEELEGLFDKANEILEDTKDKLGQ